MLKKQQQTNQQTDTERTGVAHQAPARSFHTAPRNRRALKNFFTTVLKKENLKTKQPVLLHFIISTGRSRKLTEHYIGQTEFE